MKQDFSKQSWNGGRKGGTSGGQGNWSNGKKGGKGGHKGGYYDGQGGNKGGFSNYQKRKYDGWRNDFERDNRMKLPDRR